jgi:CubicO group peptidase (beta-lactamase class C family)
MATPSASPHRLTRLLATIVLFGASLRADSVDDTVTTILSQRHIPGVSLAVIQNGRIVRAQGYGVVEAGRPERITADTLFQAGSISKPVAALGVLHLVDAGRLTLDADVNEALQTWRVPENAFTKENKVTLRRLLSHSAGLTVHGFPGYPVGARVPTLVQILNGELPANTAAIRVNQVPGSQWRYSGGGYVVIQQLVLDVTGEPFPEYMRRTVLEPMGMHASTFEQPLPEAPASTATGHHFAMNPVSGRWHVYPEMAAAGLWTTPSDLARLAIGVQASLAGRHGPPVISPMLTREMLTRQRNNSGLGFMISGQQQTRRFQHGGRDEGFDALLIAYCETGQGAVVMINANDNSGAVDQIMSAIADEYEWPDFPRIRWYTPAIVQLARLLSAAHLGTQDLAGGLAVVALFGLLIYRLRSRSKRAA